MKSSNHRIAEMNAAISVSRFEFFSVHAWLSLLDLVLSSLISALASAIAVHAAIADFLLTRAAVAGLSTNYDTLIELRAWDYGADFRGSLDGDEAKSERCAARIA
jgi:hypothetical protein